MKKIFTQLRRYSLALSALLLSGSLSAFADTEYTNYTESFDSIDTSVTGFAPEYWHHDVPNYGAKTFTAHETGGYLNGYISAPTASYYSIECLVTPLVKGNVSFYVKTNNETAQTYPDPITLYKYTLAGTKLIRGEEMSLPSGFKTNNEWQKVTLTLDEYTAIGIRFSDAAIDEFSADNMLVADTRAFEILDYTIVTPSPTLADKYGHAKLTATFKIKNTGDVTLKPGDTNYGVHMYSTYPDLTIATKDIDVTLAPGETSEDMEISGDYILADPTVGASQKFIYLAENMYNQGTYNKMTIKSYAATFTLKYGSTTITSSSKINFGMANQDDTFDFTVSNAGGSALSITAIEFGDGLEGSYVKDQLPLTVEAGTENAKTVKISLGNTEGVYSGNVTFKYNNNVNDEDLSLQFAIKGGVVDKDSWREDFSENKIPDGWINQPASNGTQEWTVKSSSGNYYINHAAYNFPSKLILPKMHIESGKKLYLAAYTSYLSDDSKLTIYYSADRVNWTQLGVIQKTVPEGSRVSNLFAWGDSRTEFDWYAFTKLPEGDWYIALEGASCNVDNIFGLKKADVDYDLYINSISADKKGSVNHAVAASIDIWNLLYKEVAASDYTAELYADGVKVADGKSVALDKYGKVSIDFSYVPHTATESILKATVKIGNTTLESQEITVSVSEESADIDVTVQEPNTNATTSSSDPLYGGYGFAYTEFIIPASYINVPVGTVINKIAFPGHYSAYSDYIANVTLAVAPIEATEFDEEYTYTAPDDANIVYTNEAYKFDKEGSSTDPYNYQFVLNKPITFNGENLHVWFIHKFKTYSDVYFLKYTDSTRKYCSVGSADYSDTETPTNRGLKNTMPVVIFSYSLSPAEVIGNVVADGAAVAGAKVTLSTEADVVYSGVTAEDGTFDIPVIQSGQDFTLTVTAEGYPTYTATVTVGSENLKVGTIDLTKGTSSIADVAAESAAKIIVNGNNLSIVADANAAVYTLDGKTVYNAYVDGEAQLTLTKGIYVVVINSANGSKSYKIAIR